MRGFTHSLRRFVAPLSTAGMGISAIALFGMMLLIVVDVVLRATVSGASLKGSVELVQILLLIVIFGGMADVGLGKRHIRITVLIDKFSPVAKLVAITCGDLLAAGIVAILSWQSVKQAQFLSSHHFTTGVLGIPWWPFAIVTAVFVAIFALVLLADFLNSLAELVAGRTKNFLWLVPGILVVLALFIKSFWPGILTIQVAAPVFGVISLLVLFILMFSGVYIGAAFAMVTVWGMSYLVSPGASLAVLGSTAQTVASTYLWSMLPLFMMMGFLVSVAGFSRDLYLAAYKWLGRLPGGLASATVVACAAFAALVGDVVSGVIAFGTLALPEMKTYKYDAKLATGCITSSAVLGTLIPPSIAFVLYGVLTAQSIGRLFIAGLIPGILAAALFVLYITIRCWRNPALGLRETAPVKFKEKMLTLKVTWPVVLLFLVVIGGIYMGIFTPIEAGAFGAFGALVATLVTRRIKTIKQVWDSAIGGARMTIMGFFIFIFAMALSQFLAVTRLPFLLASLVAELSLPPHLVLAAMMVFYFIVGCLINPEPGLILTLPVVYPTAMALGFDPIWFGVLIVIMLDVGCLTPPIGVSVFVMGGVARDVPMYSIFKGVVPFWLILLGVIVIIAVFPQVALFLPNLMYGG